MLIPIVSYPYPFVINHGKLIWGYQDLADIPIQNAAAVGILKSEDCKVFGFPQWDSASKALKVVSAMPNK